MERARVEPATARGPGRAAPVSAAPAPILGLQRTAGNRAVARMLARSPADRIRDRYGVEVDDVLALASVRALFERQRMGELAYENSPTYQGDPSRPQHARLNAIAADPWRAPELLAVEQALEHFVPILGWQRAFSNRALDPQEVTRFGKLKADPLQGGEATYGQYLGSDSAFVLYEAAEKMKGKTLRELIVHELAHGLLAYAVEPMLAEIGWFDPVTRDPIPGNPNSAEPPPTEYARTRRKANQVDPPEEDLAETAMMYFEQRPLLEQLAPRRKAFMDRITAQWSSVTG